MGTPLLLRRVLDGHHGRLAACLEFPVGRPLAVVVLDQQIAAFGGVNDQCRKRDSVVVKIAAEEDRAGARGLSLDDIGQGGFLRQAKSKLRSPECYPDSTHMVRCVMPVNNVNVSTAANLNANQS